MGGNTMRIVITTTFVLAILALSSCGLLYSDKRKVRTLQTEFINALSGDRETEALGYCDKSFTWWQQGKQVKAKEPAKAFYTSVTTTTNFDRAELELKSFTKAGKKYVGKGKLFLKQAGSTAVANASFEVNLIWQETETGWKLIKIKETTPRKSASN
jgi:hypothetical protein